ncbi:MAG: hypothetical protein Q4P24_17065 [Rhodobacterales bacterium]|nr:hypothetical protein [Rhodobacterales bacterium]
MAFLDAQTRALLFEPPDTHEDALARYALTPEDVALPDGVADPISI